MGPKIGEMMNKIMMSKSQYVGHEIDAKGQREGQIMRKYTIKHNVLLWYGIIDIVD